MGGGVRGGRIHGGWPGLAPAQLHQERDLAVATDFRDVFAELARAQFGITDTAALFPGFTPGAPLGLVAVPEAGVAAAVVSPSSLGRGRGAGRVAQSTSSPATRCWPRTRPSTAGTPPSPSASPGGSASWWTPASITATGRAERSRLAVAAGRPARSPSAAGACARSSTSSPARCAPATFPIFEVDISETSTDFGGAAGGGLDIGFGERWAARLAADYRLVSADGETEGDPRFSAGVVYRFGARESRCSDRP